MFKDAELKGTFDYLKSFGLKNEVEVVMSGTNAKMNEMQALMATEVLKYLKENINARVGVRTAERCRYA